MVALVRVAAAGAEERPVEAVAADDHVRPEPAAEEVAAAAVVEVVVDDAETVRAAGQEARRQLAAVGEIAPADRHRVGPVEPQGCPHPRTAADANAVDDDVSRAGDLEPRRHSDREDPEPDEPDGPCALEPQVADRGALVRADRQRSRAARPDDELVVAAGPEDDRAAAGPELLHGGRERALRADQARRPRVGRPRRDHCEYAGEVQGRVVGSACAGPPPQGRPCCRRRQRSLRCGEFAARACTPRRIARARPPRPRPSSGGRSRPGAPAASRGSRASARRPPC